MTLYMTILSGLLVLTYRATGLPSCFVFPCEFCDIYNYLYNIQMRPMEVRLVGRFRFHSRLEGEHESLLYRAIHTQTNQPLVLKGEQAKTAKAKKGALSLLQEGKVYQSMQGGIGIPYMHWCGQEEDFNFIVLEELQATITKKLSICGGKLSLKSSMMLVMELVTIFQYFHFKYFVYSNINPRHVMIGKGEKYGKFFLIDFSRASRYKDAQTSQHIIQLHEKSVEIRNHNIEFSSISYHKGYVPSRRDDLQSLLYFVLFLLKGELPWSSQVRNLKKTDFQKSRCVLDLKTNLHETLFSGYPELQSLYTYTLSLKFQEKPQYSYYSSTFSQILQKRGLLEDKIYDWMLMQSDEMSQQLAHHFDIYSNEEQFLKKVGGEMGSITNQKLAKSIKISDKGNNTKKGKNDKQCIIY